MEVKRNAVDITTTHLCPPWTGGTLNKVLHLNSPHESTNGANCAESRTPSPGHRPPHSAKHLHRHGVGIPPCVLDLARRKPPPKPPPRQATMPGHGPAVTPASRLPQVKAQRKQNQRFRQPKQETVNQLVTLWLLCEHRFAKARKIPQAQARAYLEKANGGKKH